MSGEPNSWRVDDTNTTLIFDAQQGTIIFDAQQCTTGDMLVDAVAHLERTSKLLDASVRSLRDVVAAQKSAARRTKCGLCGGQIGPDVTGRPMCYACGPQEMRPADCWQCDEPLGTSPGCMTCEAKRREDTRDSYLRERDPKARECQQCHHAAHAGKVCTRYVDRKEGLSDLCLCGQLSQGSKDGTL